MIEQSNQQTVWAPIGWSVANVFDKAKSPWARIADMLTAYAEAWDAAMLYEELSKLSDADLKRRGLRRADLHRHVFKTSRKR
jgi:hypothetical protein